LGIAVPSDDAKTDRAATKVQFGAGMFGAVARPLFLAMHNSRFGDRIAALVHAVNMSEERRRTLRFPFKATAEVSQVNSEARWSARVTEISLNGCFLQLEEPFPDGTMLLVKIFVEGSFFEASAKVVYSQPQTGVGIAFHDLKPYFVSVLKKWLLTAMLEKNKPQPE
jgi:hypothetical protein